VERKNLIKASHLADLMPYSKIIGGKGNFYTGTIDKTASSVNGSGISVCVKYRLISNQTL
jgi:hypothetical protein